MSKSKRLKEAINLVGETCSNNNHCPICDSEVSSKAKYCTECKFFLNKYRRALHFSTTVLSLLIAFFAVLGVIAPNLVKLYNGFDSELVISFHQVNDKGFHFLVVNKGGKPGVIYGGSLKINNLKCAIPLHIQNSVTNALIVEAKKSKLISLVIPDDSIDRDTCDSSYWQALHGLPQKKPDYISNFTGTINISNYKSNTGNKEYSFPQQEGVWPKEQTMQIVGLFKNAYKK